MFSTPEQLFQIRVAYNQAQEAGENYLEQFNDYLRSQLKVKLGSKGISRAINIISNTRAFQAELNRLEELQAHSKALTKGRTTYHSFTPCGTCSNYVRYVSNRACIACSNPNHSTKQAREIQVRNIISMANPNEEPGTLAKQIETLAGVSRATAYRLIDKIRNSTAAYKKQLTPIYDPPAKHDDLDNQEHYF